MTKGITLRVDVDSLGKLIRDLAGMIDPIAGLDGRAVMLSVDPTPDDFIVYLDKHQRRYLENKMTIQAFADEYGAARE